jgi:peptidoglycan hydrolase CwlO-like protein
MGAAIIFIPVGASAATLQEQIDALNAQIGEQQTHASEAHAKADTLQNKIAELNGQISSARNQMYLIRNKQQLTAARIAEVEKDLAHKKEILNENVRAIYQQSSISPLEMLASSRSFSDFVDKQQYTDTIKDHVQEASKAVAATKVELERQKRSLAVQADDISRLQVSLNAAREQQNQILAQTQGEESRYQADIASKNTEKRKLEAQQAAILAAARQRVNFGGTRLGTVPGASGGRGGLCDNGQGNGGYPMIWCNASQDSMIDSWRMFNRECVSYAAFRRQDLNASGWGNARDWMVHTNGSTPRVGAVAVTGAGPYGHVAIVEEVRGNQVVVAEMNGDGYGHFDYGLYQASYFRYIY